MIEPIPVKPLRIGFASVYAWRPHVEHLMFLARLAQGAGHEVAFLACDADIPACYTRELRDVRPDWMECLLCRAGGVRSYTGHNVASIGTMGAKHVAKLPQTLAREWAASSASTLGRFESPDDYTGTEFAELTERLAPSVAMAFGAASEWIARERLDAVCVFNGRIDATRAIFEAARSASVRAITVERSWSGDGIQLLPEENCLGFRSMHAIVGEWRDRPLTPSQACVAAARIAARITRTNFTEWRAYNTQGVDASWPSAGNRRKLLLLPGSLNEIWGDPGWVSGWPDATAAYDAIRERLGLGPADMVLRCHPNWSEKIGKRDGSRPEAYYTQWARARGVPVIASADRTSTMSLIAQSDAVVLASGSAALEAAAMGKQVISTAPSPYHEAGFRTDMTRPELLKDLVLDVDLPEAERELIQERLRRLALRFSYTTTHRMPQYVRHVRAVSSSAYRYSPGADATRFIDLIRSGRLEADDTSWAADTAGEDETLAQMRAGRWDVLAQRSMKDEVPTGKVRRRWLFQPIDLVREKMPVGDR
jgi:hypothetical protein